MTGIVEGRSHNEDVVNRLHGIIRPFVLRRLKKDVESQMPGKFEHVVKCQLSRRQMFIYEEFMARSSTRQSLKKGGNFMDMMNVLMQLRKVCNHPDLFEPRPVVTPFVMDSIFLSVPSKVLDMVSSGVDSVSQSLVLPIWSGSCGLPSTHSALRHDMIEYEALMTLHEISLAQNYNKEPSSETAVMSSTCAHDDHLALLWLELESEKRREKADKLASLKKLNQSRCSRAPFPYSSPLLKQVAILLGTPEIISTPSSLLALLRSQRERARDVNELVKKFVFCVPKAGARSPLLEANSSPRNLRKHKSMEDLLFEPLEEAASPFQEADARLSSCFPDKNLVQFDAGKLQVLAELLRELKRGGHRVLIFTQMSKMLDILEVSDRQFCPLITR
jgi:SNF2 family DNA or RNA helicase